MAIYNKWIYRPVIVSFDDKTTSVGMITFPAVTICSTQKYLVDQINISKILQTFIDMENNQGIYKDLTPMEWAKIQLKFTIDYLSIKYNSKFSNCFGSTID